MGRHPLVAKWVLCDRAQNPPRRSLVPRWNLSVVLSALIEKPFEPLRQATPRNLSLKVLFLLAATSAHRVSEIHALCIDSPFLIQNPRSFRLAPNPAFLPKTSTEVAFSLDLEITAFSPDPSNDLERGFHLMCPVRALRIYLKCTEHSRGPNWSLSTGMREGPIVMYRIDGLAPLLWRLFVPLIVLKARSTRFSVLTRIRYGAWRPPGPKLPEYRPQKFVVWLPGLARALLPNSTVWIFPTAVLEVPFLKRPHGLDQHKCQR